MKKLMILTLLVMAGLFVSAQIDNRNQLVRQIAKGDTITSRIYTTYDTYDGTNPILVNYYDSIAFVGSRGLGIGGYTLIYDSAKITGNLKLGGSLFTNTISPYSGTTTTFPQRLTVTGRTTLNDQLYFKNNAIINNDDADTLELTETITKVSGAMKVTENLTISPTGSLYLDSTSTTGYGAIYKGGNRWLSDFRHPTGNTARPTGRNIMLGYSVGNLTMGSTATSVTHGSNNIIIGSASGNAITTGNNNVILGNSSATALTTGVDGVYIGSFIAAAGSENMCIGSYSTTGANSNISLGYAAGYYYGSGTSQYTSNGTNNILIGKTTRLSTNTGETNSTVIGYNAISNGSNTVTLGNASITGWYATRQTTAATAGTNLIIQSSGAVSSGTNLNGGMMTLAYGQSTGTGIGSLRLQRRARASASGTSDNTAQDAIIIPSQNNLSDNVLKQLFEVTLPTDSAAGGHIDFTITATDGDSTQCYTGRVVYAAANFNNTVVTQITEHDAITVDSPAAMTDMTTAWTITSTAGTKIAIEVTANAGFTPARMKIYYTIHNGSMSAVTQL